PTYDHAPMLRVLTEAFPGALLVGSSSAGEFTHASSGDDSACVLALWSDEVRFAAGVGRALRASPAKAAADILSSFRGQRDTTLHRAALVLTDALAGCGPDLIDQLVIATKAQYQFFGGGAGDNGRFVSTVVFHGAEVLSDAAVALEIVSPRPLGVGIGHGWEPAAETMRVTAVEGRRLIGLNGLPAMDAFEAHAEATGQVFDAENPLPFFLHNILGIEVPDGFQLRAPMSVDAEGAIHCGAEIPVGSLVRIMRSTVEASRLAAERATKAALAKLGGQPPGVALFFDCAATRFRVGDAYTAELETVRGNLDSLPMVGCITYGQIGRAEGQFDTFQNCTALVCVLPA
ncbi:MAG: FIST signal transduction protein, partial [Janthinobacterium lividum]